MRSFVGGLAVIVFLSSAPAVSANTITELEAQLAALTDYISHHTDTEPLSTAEERVVINAGATWIIAAQEESGRYEYEYLPFTDEYSADDATVRQAGTFSSLADIFRQQTDKDPAIESSLERSVEYFESITKSVETDEHTFSCIKKSAKASRCDLGATALALVGLFGLVEGNPEKRDEHRQLIDSYVAYLLAAKHEGAGFSDRYYFKDGFSDSESPFYNGEAMLALVRYYQYEQSEEIKAMLEELFIYLSAKEYESPLYLWIMAALKDMQQLWPNDAYVEYAHDFTKERLFSAELRHSTDHNYCAPLEGLVSSHSILGGSVEENFTDRLYGEIEFWLKKTTRLQLAKDAPYRVNTVDGTLQLVKIPDPVLAHGGFLTSESTLTQRIDFTQHCISAYLQKLVDIDGQSL